MAGTGQLAFIPSPSVNGIHIGPLDIHVYGLMYVVAITLAIVITRRRWRAAGGDPDLVGDVALWAVPAGIIGGRIYFDITTPKYIPHHWYGIFAVWDGGLVARRGPGGLGRGVPRRGAVRGGHALAVALGVPEPHSARHGAGDRHEHVQPQPEEVLGRVDPQRFFEDTER